LTEVSTSSPTKIRRLIRYVVQDDAGKGSWHGDCAQESGEGVTMHKLFVSMTVTGLVCGYVAMLYAFIRMVVIIDHSYFLSLGM
jgi:hypothetical protein